MNFLTDRGPVSPPDQTNTNVEQHSAVVSNERMTALAGAVLLVLIIAEIVIAANMHALMILFPFIAPLLV